MDENLIINVPEFQNGDIFQILNEGQPNNITTDLSVSQGVPTQDVNVYQSGDQTTNCLTFETSELLSQVQNTEQCIALDDDFFNLPPLDKSILDSLHEIEPDTRNSNSDTQIMIYNENSINGLPGGSGAIFPCQNSLGLGFGVPAGLKEVDELTRASMEQIDPNCIGWNAPIFSTHLMDSGISQQNPKAPNPLCQSCQIMRRIIHSNGIQDSRLEIHGLHGQPLHAVSECRPRVNDEKESSLNREVIRFQSPEHVTQFIAEYNHVRRLEGSVLRHDTFLMNAITATQSWWPAWDINPSVFQNNVVKKAGTSSYLPKSSYSAQRQRTGKIQISELARYFHLPISEAAKRLRICPTVIKKICRRNELRRWPYRKVRSIDRNIQTLESQLVGGNGEINESIKSQIEALRNEKAQLYEGFTGQNKEEPVVFLQ
ncbi:hypothetical protein SUGI_0999710 [Cryptomeria japonica]|nr:hypothetical protein SUGI_0999710 [Cryptomeria japonica]